MELNFKLNNEDEALNESSSPGGFLSNFHDFDPFDGVEGQPPKTPGLTPTSPVAAHFSMPSQVVATYESVANEFLKDERSYLRELNRINIFRRRLESVAGEDTKALLRVLCGNLADIHELTMKVERTLEDAIEMSDAPTVGMGLWDLAEALEFNAYLTYIARETDDSDSEELLSPAIDRIINQILNSPVFASLFGSEDRYDNSSLDGSSFRLTVKYVLPHLLHLPILHFFRYVEYVNRLLRLTSSEDDRDELKNCRVELSKVKSALEQRCQELPDLKANIQASIEALNRNDSPICQVKRLKAIQESIDGFIGDSIAKKCSELIKEGDVHILRPSLTFSPEILRKSGWKTERHIFLFDQLVVMCKKHKTLKFKERLSVQWIDVVDIENDGDLQHAFRLDYRERSTSRSFTIICKTEDEKKQWMEVFVKATTRSVLDRILDNYLKEEEKRIPLVLPSLEQYKFAEPDNEENISFEDYTTSSGIPVIKTGTVVKLVERLTYHQYTDNKFVQTFLISYRSFCTPSELLNMLIERFYVPVPQRGGPLAGRYDTVQSHGLSGTNLHSPHSEQSFQRFRKEYERPIQLRVLNVMNQWVKCHWYDFDNDRELLLALQKFLQKSMEPSQKLTNQHRKFCKLILAAIDKRLNQLAEKDKPQDGHVNTAFVYGEEQLNASLNTSLNGSFNGVSTPGPTGIASTPLSAGNSSANRANGTTTNSFQPKKPEVVWHTARKGDFANYDLLTLHPLEIGRQLTLLHFDLYRAIKPIELVGAAWTKHDKYRKSPQLLKLTDHSTLLTYWVSRSIVETESLEERVAMLNRALDVMSVFEELHNFTGLVAFLSALNSSCVHRLSWCWSRLDNEKQKSYDRFVTLCEPRWQEMQKRLQTINPPCVPFFGHYLSSIFFFEAGNSTFVKSPGVKDMKTPESTTVDGQSPTAHNRRVLVSFLKCRRISELIREIQMYQNQPYSLQLEPSIRFPKF
ncbi:hypothetical protein WR25_10109 isoform B [Diploscapter pachys]|uniref:Ras-GEF domain-containing protein n=1 Tax=Diploscapter pachys TaxID=2018661 RepID=A0A2A2J5T2_9BILA|nr:hypothetical protein WR25_10109 isoform A [Diploscapter pachys]PAV56934.1 hypothetical protein WR25_10109 isoform B [Diploscapter pachys]